MQQTADLEDKMSHKPLTERAVLVDLSISMWGASVKDPVATADLALDKNADTKAIRVTKRLVNAEAMKDLRSAAKAAKEFHMASTLPWNDRGIRLLPISRVQSYKVGIERLTDEMIDARGRFVAEYERHVREAKASLGTLFDPKDYPSVAEIERKVGITVDIEPVPDRTHFADGLLGEDEDRIRDDIEMRNQARIQLGVQDLFASLGEAVRRLADRMGFDTDDDGTEKARKFKDTVITNLQDAAERAKELDITENDVLQSLATEAVRLVDDVDVEILRPTSGKKVYSEHVRQKLQKDASALADRFAGYFPLGN